MYFQKVPSTEIYLLVDLCYLSDPLLVEEAYPQCLSITTPILFHHNINCDPRCLARFLTPENE
jgi:hypothetical protein